MQTYTHNGIDYRLPNDLNEFQIQMYVHLIHWKWAHLTKEAGRYSFRGKEYYYDAIIPLKYQNAKHPIYQPIITKFSDHFKKNGIREHKFIGHMASSQAACINLFLPLLQFPDLAATVLKVIKTDLLSIADDQLDSGFRFEFWGEPSDPLNDHTNTSGTDADLAIAYRDRFDNLNLWLIEHKLTEPDFTSCGGYKSPKRKKTNQYQCESIDDIVSNSKLCYYSGAKEYRYWDLTLEDGSIFANRDWGEGECPFRGGMNQLWRNQLLAFAMEKRPSPYKKVYFSVVHHPKNEAITATIDAYRHFTGVTDRFFTFTSSDVVESVKRIDDKQLCDWVTWYQELYFF